MAVRRALFFILLTAISAFPAFAQRNPSRQTYEIQGYVRDDSNQQPMENVRVDLKQNAGSPMNSTFTRSNGEFEFAALASGQYTIEVIVPGYEPADESVSLYNNSVHGMGIFLTKPVTFSSPGESGMISAHQLSAPQKARDEYDKGVMLLYRKRDYKGAILQFDRAIRDFPNYYEAYTQEGDAYKYLADTAHAEQAYKKAIDISGGQFSDALFDLSGLLSDLRRYSEAEGYARKGIAVNSASWKGPFDLALALSGLKKTDEAEKSAIQARDQYPNNPSVYLMLANLHMQQRNMGALDQDLTSYLKLAPDGPEAEQARKTKDLLQTHAQQAKDQNREAAHSANDRDTASSSLTAPPDSEPSPQPEPDTSGLPSLPPPSESAQ